MFKRTLKEVYPVLLLRDIVVFPGMIAPLLVGRARSVSALEAAFANGKKIFLVTQQSATEDDPSSDKIYKTGVVCSILHFMKLPDGNVKALVEGEVRTKIKAFSQGTTHALAEVVAMEDEPIAGTNAALEPLMRTVIKQFGEYLKLNRKIPPEMLTAASQIIEAGRLADAMAGYMPLKITEKQELLENLNPEIRLEKISAYIEREIGILQTETKIRGRVRGQLDKNQKDYYLNEQMKAIQKELDEDDGKDEVGSFEKKINELKLTPEAKEKALSELKKFKTMSPLSAEATVIRNYLDWITSIPWQKPSAVQTDIHIAEEVLDKQHYALGNVKERILEYLAVQSRTGKMRGPILCLVGPPGVGKTSLGRSIAESTGRQFAKIALGGMRDEAEIRGHRRTYIGSMPGKIVQALKKTKASNPLIMLDEIDKMSNDFRGDPSSALLEVLDPEQNSKFNDHYLEVDYDLSDVMFIATANSLNLPRPLLDRMEIIRVSGYTEDEKQQIVRRHLIPKLLESHGLKASEWDITDEAIRHLIRYYTREAGVRSLERELANLIRKAVKQIVSGTHTNILVTAQNLPEFSKVRKYNYGQKESNDLVGITTGLAYTETGGDILQIEAVAIPLANQGRGEIKCTGNLEKVMKESIEAASSFVRSRCYDFGILPSDYQHKDIHVHVPEGATPKDGPSAGVAMCTSIVSVLTGIPVKANYAMTGEITLRGRVLAIGGLKEKLLAALRSGITTVLIPLENVKDLAEIPDNVKNAVEIIPVSTVDEVLRNALVTPPVALEVNADRRIIAHSSNENDLNQVQLPH